MLRRACVDLDVNAQGERGTLGIALHPKFDRNNLLYVYYTNASPLENRVTRFKVNKNRWGGRRSPVWSYGHRNPFGLTHKPGTSVLLQTENGPECDDEVNRILKGRNYGWGPGYSCGTAGVGPNPKGPLHRWTPTIAPTDPLWYKGPLRRLSGSMYVGDFKIEKLRRFRFNRKVSRVRSSLPIYQSPRQISDVAKGPGGCLYIATFASIIKIARASRNSC